MEQGRVLCLCDLEYHCGVQRDASMIALTVTVVGGDRSRDAGEVGRFLSSHGAIARPHFQQAGMAYEMIARDCCCEALAPIALRGATVHLS
jgi:hypothetical protein